MGGPLQSKARTSGFSATNESPLVQVRPGRADDQAETASLGSMADTRSLDSFQSLKGTRQASKRNRVRAPRLENLRCGDAHCRPMKARLEGGEVQALPSLGVLGAVRPPHELPLLPHSREGRGRRRRSAWRAQAWCGLHMASTSRFLGARHRSAWWTAWAHCCHQQGRLAMAQSAGTSQPEEP